MAGTFSLLAKMSLEEKLEGDGTPLGRTLGYARSRSIPAPGISMN